MKPSRMMITTFLLSTAGTIVMLLIRMLISGTPTYYFLVYNLFLAWIPLLFSTSLVVIHEKRHIKYKRLKQAILAILWLLFIPNSPYLLTDFIHLKLRDSTPLWFDVLLFESFTIVGLMLGTISAMQVERLIKEKIGKKKSTYVSLGIFFLVSFGVALGRFFRFNSWDVFVTPHLFIKQVAFSLITPYIWIESIAFSIFFFFFLTGTHFLVKTIDEWKR